MYAILLCVSPRAPIKHRDDKLEHAGQRICRKLREVLACYLIRGPVLYTCMGLLSFGALSPSPACSWLPQARPVLVDDADSSRKASLLGVVFGDVTAKMDHGTLGLDVPKDEILEMERPQSPSGIT